MAVKWTEDQLRVINEREKNILVSAAAGSGKTAVLVERVIQMIMDDKNPVGIDEIVVVTFTEAAAAEMKERIRLAIEKKLKEEPENARLREQAALVMNAKISTIHGFCLSVIRDNFHEIDIDPSLRIAEEGELVLMKEEILEELLETYYEAGEEAFLKFINAYAGKRNDDSIKSIILSLYNYARSYPDPDSYLTSCITNYEINSLTQLDESKMARAIIKNVKNRLGSTIKLYHGARQLALLEGGPLPYDAFLAGKIEEIEAIRAASSYSKLYEAFKSYQKGTMPRISTKEGSPYDEELKNLARDLKEQGDTIIKEVQEAFFYQSPSEMITDFAICKKHIEVIIELVRAFDLKFKQVKKQKNIIDFSDMEHFALQILTIKEGDEFLPSKVAIEYQKNIKEIMIDEYQDSNLLQEVIFKSISGMSKDHYNLFMVGDIKQSIYRFRLARPDLFMHKYNTYSLTGEKERLINLDQNFRSRREILAGTNYVFEKLMKPEIGGVDYNEEAKLKYGASFEKNEEGSLFKGNEKVAPEVCVIDTPQNMHKDELLEVETRFIASRIKELVRNNKASYRDIVILLRNIKGVAEEMKSLLSEYEIPAYVSSQVGYFSTREVSILLDYLQIIDNRKQDIPLTAILTSSFVGLSEEELAKLKVSGQSKRFYDNVFSYQDQGEDEQLRKKIKQLYDNLEYYSKQAKYLPIHELLYQIVHDTHYLSYVSALKGGEQKRANVLMLIEKAKNFDATSFQGVFNFIQYINNMKKYEVEVGEASIDTESSNVVRIMSIHKSKGLQFPVVFVAKTGGRKGARKTSLLETDSKFGIGIDMIDGELGIKEKGLIKKVMAEEDTLEGLGEELRILYVAMTRAKEKLIITGTMQEGEKKRETLRHLPVPEYLYNKPGNYLNILLPVILEKKDSPFKISIITEEEINQREVHDEVRKIIQRADLQKIKTEASYNEEMAKVIKEQLEYKMPNYNKEGIKTKLSVSEIKRLTMEEEFAEEPLYGSQREKIIPQFIQEDEVLKGAQRGTAYHRVMQLLDFAKDYQTIDDVKESLERLKEAGRIDEKTREIIKEAELLKFFNSTVGKELQIAGKQNNIHKEQPFVIGIKAKDVYPEVKTDEIILVQGIIDLYYYYEGQLKVLDYKTDRVKNEAELVDKYHSQLVYYQRALTQILDEEVSEKIIYSFQLGKAIFL